MKRLSLIIVIISYYSMVYAQDLIVTQQGDSINCRITKIESEFIHFTYNHSGEIRNTLLRDTQVLHLEYGYFEESEVPPEETSLSKRTDRFRLAAHGGFSYMMARVADNVPSDFKDYIRQLKTGYHFGADATYFVSESYGLGLKYCLFKSKNSIDNIYAVGPNGQTRYGKMSDDLSISFFGPSLVNRSSNNDKSRTFIAGFAIGYMGYLDKKVIIDSYTLTGATMGLSFEGGYDIKLKGNSGIGFQISYISGLLSEFIIDNGITKETMKFPKGEFESLHRIDFSIGYRFVR